MPRPFDFSEFCLTAATLKARGYTRGAGGGYTQTPVSETIGFSVSHQSLTGQRSQFSGSPVSDATSVAYTSNLTLTPNNGDFVDIAGVEYEIVFYEKVFETYYALWLVEGRE